MKQKLIRLDTFDEEQELTDFDVGQAEHDAEMYDRYIQERFCEKQTSESWLNKTPPLIFKYRKADTAKDLVRLLDVLNNCRLYMPRVAELNDPFEGQNVRYLSEENRAEYLETIEKCRILSLSENCFSAPLWAHYASVGAGVCIGFTTFDSFAKIEKLEYADTIDKKQWWAADKTFAVQKEFLCKHYDWAYECEYRIVKECAKGDDAYLHFKPDELALIILGDKMDNEVKETIKSVVANCILTLEITPDKNRSRYYLTKVGDSKPIAFTIEDLYNIVFKKKHLGQQNTKQ